MSKAPIIDAYILKAEPFAQEILLYLRNLIHETCPDVEEGIKWRFPHFNYKGEILCSMAAFKKHCAFGFWKATMMEQNKEFIEIIGRTAMGHLGRITKLSDLPSKKILKACLKEAMQLNELGIKVQKKIVPPKNKQLKIPVYFALILNKNKKAKEIFEKASYSFKNEYVEWITGAKTELTRNKRMQTAIEWISEGKGRNWKYERK